MGIVTLHAENASLASFRSAAKVPIRSLKSHFTPVQQGTGDASPTNIRPIVGWTGLTVKQAGKNLFDKTNYNYINAYIPTTGTGVLTDSSSRVTVYMPCKPNTTYTVQKIAQLTDDRFYLSYTKELPAVGIATYGGVKAPDSQTVGNKSSTTITTGNDAKYLVCWLSWNADALANEINTFQIELGSTATPYTPYAGTTIPVTFPAVGKNLVDWSQYPFTDKKVFYPQAVSTTTGEIVDNDYHCATLDFIPCNHLRGKEVTFSPSESIGSYASICFYASDSVSTFISAANKTATVPSNASYMRFATERVNLNAQKQLELGSTATTYEPFTNTVYGGYVDLISGDVVGEWAGINLTKDIVMDNIYTYNGMNGIETTNVLPVVTNRAVGICSHCPKVGSYYVENSMWVGVGSRDIFWIGILDTLGLSTVSAFKDWLDTQTVTIAYQLATPVTLATLTPTELSTLLDRNNVWSSAGGKIEVDYDLHETKAIGDAKKRIIVNTPHLATTTPAPVASFNTDMVGKLKSAKFGFLPIQNGSGNAFPEQTYNGSVVSFNYQQTKTDPLEFKANFLPKQEGTGDPSPTNVRSISGWNGVTVEQAGKNLFDQSTLSNESSYTDKLGNYYYTKPIKLQPNTEYYLSSSSSPTLSASLYYVLYVNPSENDPDYLVSVSDVFRYPVNAGKPTSIRFTTGSTGTIRFGIKTQTLAEIMSVNWQLELGSTATSYAPYTGSTYPITFPATGKNLFNPNGTYELIKTRYYQRFIWQNEPCVMSFVLKDSNVDLTDIYFGFAYDPTDINSGYRWVIQNGAVQANKANTSILDNSKICQYITYYPGTNEAYTKIMQAYDIQVEKGSTATTYEPYTNTAYGGYVDVVNGVLTVDRAYMVLNGTQTELDENVNWRPKANSVGWYYNFSAQGMKMPSSINDTANIVCDSCKTVTYNEIFDNDISSIAQYSASGYDRIFVRVTDTSLTTKQAVNTYLAAHPIAFVYELATPITIPISPQTVSLLANSVNTVWSDADSVTVKVGNVRPISGWTRLTAEQAGVNIWDEQWENGYIIDGIEYSSSTSIRSKNYTPVVSNTTYYLHCGSATSIYFVRPIFYDANKNFISNSPWCTNGTFTTPENCYYIRLTTQTSTVALYGGTYNNNISVNYPSIDTAYHPYTGSTIPVTFGAVNKNLCPVENHPQSTAFWGANYAALQNALNTLPAGTYSISTKQTIDSLGDLSSVRADGVLVFANGASITTARSTITDNSPAVGKSYTTTSTFTISSADVGNISKAYLYFGDTQTSTFKGTIDHIQVEAGSTATPYVPYGTLYGGYVDLVAGELVQTHKKVVLNDSTKWTNTSTLDNYFVRQYDIPIPDHKTGDKYIITSSIAPSYYTNASYWIQWNKNSGYYFTLWWDTTQVTPTPLEDIQTLSSNNAIEIFYPLATPITYQLTPQQITTLKGVNNLWSDANGDAQVTYWTH